MAPHHIPPSSSSDSDEEILYQAAKLAFSSALPMVFNSALQLNLFQLIKDAGPSASLSAADLASLIPAVSDPHHAATQIDRILCFLSGHSVVSFTLKPLPDGKLHRFYSLLPVCKYLTADENGNSLAPVSLMLQSKVMMDSWYHVKDMVLQGGIPFNRAHGMTIFEYAGTHPEFNHLFNQGLCQSSSIILNKLLQVYDGFLGVKSLVDVGGGTGATLQAILAKFPNIEKAINFDLPHVVSKASPHPRIDHVGGDMFVAVPKADVIFMKSILHDWSDEHCAKLLKKCYEAVDEKGKVVVLDVILMKEVKEGKGSDWAALEWAARMDVVMLATNPGGKERSEEEFEALAKAAGFKRFIKVCYAYNNWVMEFHK